MISPVLAKVLAGWDRKRKPPTYLEFSRTLTLPTGPLAGSRYDPDSDPCQRYLIDQMDSGLWRRIYCTTPPQLGGKTQVLVLLPLLRNAIGCQLPVGYGLPTLKDVDKAYTAKLKKALEKSGYGGHLPTFGPGSKGGRGHTLQFSDPSNQTDEGMVIFMAGGAIGDTCAVPVIDEIDSFRDADGTPRWGDIEDIFSRAAAYRDKALRIGTGTIEDDERPIVLTLINDHGTGTWPWPKCPHCDRYQRLSWDQINLDEGRLACIHCATIWDKDDHIRALFAMRPVHKGQTIDDTGATIGPIPETNGVLGFAWSCLESVRADLQEVVTERMQAQAAIDARGEHGPMRKFCRYRLVQPYTGDQIKDDGTPARITKDYLVARSSASTYAMDYDEHIEDGDSLHVATLPREAEWLTAALDVQRGGNHAPGRIYFLLQGGDAMGRTWDIAWGDIKASPIGSQPTTEQLHACLDRCHAKLNELAANLGRSIVRRGVDVGDRQDEIRLWLVRHAEWWPVKGTNERVKCEPGFDLAEWIYRRAQEKGRWYLYMIDSANVRRQAQAAFLVPAGRPSAAHLPRGLKREETLIKHYCATAEIPDGRGGIRWSEREGDRKHHPEWAKRRDLLDCRTYCAAMNYQYLRVRTVQRQAEEAEAANPPSNERAPDWIGAGKNWDIGGSDYRI